MIEQGSWQRRNDRRDRGKTALSIEKFNVDVLGNRLPRPAGETS